jgi:hypothetical protein
MRARGGVLVFLALAAGCGPAPRADTGAREAAERFGAALCRGDWPAAYRELHPDCRKECDAEEFAGRAAGYRAAFRFRPDRIVVRSCEEQGGQAVAHVVFRGPGSRQRFKDALVLRRQADGWGVVLGERFGRER